jgi:hypothetical protein
VVQGR